MKASTNKDIEAKRIVKKIKVLLVKIENKLQDARIVLTEEKRIRAINKLNVLCRKEVC